MTATITEDTATITGIQFISAYVDDFDAAYDFYTRILGLKKEYNMGDRTCFFELGTGQGLYLQGDNKIRRADPITSHTSFTLGVNSVRALFCKLQEANIQTVEEEPIKIGETMYWFRFYDPAGNLLEAIGDI